MNATFDPEAVRERDRAQQAGQLLSDFLGGAPSFPPEGRDPDLAGSVGPRIAAPLFLDALGQIYHLRRWGVPAFKRAVLQGAIASWKPGTFVREDASGFRVVSPVCPVADAAEENPERCARCQAFQVEVAREALGAAFDGAHFERTIVHGESDCALRIRVKREAA